MSPGRKGWPSYLALYELSIRHNILVPLILLLIAVVFKVLDVFVLRLDELLGEIILSKSIGFQWPVKNFITGQIDLSGVAFRAIMLLVATGIFGFAVGYLYLKTDNLWAPWLAHTINNSVLNMVHIETAEGLDSDTALLQVMLIVCYVAVIPLFRAMAKRFQMPEVRPWGREAS